MSGITSSVQSSSEINTNSMQDPQKSASLHGRAFHKITDGGKYIIQSINKVAQSILSTCIYVVSFGRCDLDSLKSYFFSNQTALKDNATASSSSSPTRSAPPLPSNPPPPPPMPTQEDLKRASSGRSSNEETRESTFQSSITSGDLNRSSSIRSGVNFTQNASQEDDNTLEDGANSKSILGSSLHEDSDCIIEGENNNEPNVIPQKKTKGIQKKIDQGKQAVGNLFAGVKDSPLFKKMKDKVNH